MTVEAALPAGHVLDRPRSADVDEILAVVHACDIAAIGFPDFTADDVQEWLDAPFGSPDLDGWTVRDEQGRLVAWAYIENMYGGRSEDGSIYLHPEADQGLYRPLVDLVVQRSAERAATADQPDHNLLFWCANEPVLAQTVAAVGARKAKTFAQMRRTLDGTEGGVTLPDGVTITGVDPDDEPVMREFHTVYQAAFGSHFAFEPSTYEAWRAHLAAAPSTPYDQWLVARADGSIIGVMQAADHAEDGGGWVRNLGVLPTHRGRGIARVLLDRAFAVFHERGFTWAGLGVDLQNETGAYRLYESVGMNVKYKADAWELTVPATALAGDSAGVGGRG